MPYQAGTKSEIYFGISWWSAYEIVVNEIYMKSQLFNWHIENRRWNTLCNLLILMEAYFGLIIPYQYVVVESEWGA